MKVDITLEELKIIVKDYRAIMLARRIINNGNFVSQKVKNETIDDDIVRMSLLKRFRKLVVLEEEKDDKR